MTIPELLEKRYGPRIRWAAGVVIVLGGLLNMGVFLRVTGEFLVLVCGFKMAALHVPALAIGNWHTPAFQLGYLELMMTALLLLGTIYTVVGGLLSVLVTDFLQFIVMSCGLIAVTVLILTNIGWDRLATTVSQHCQAGGFNPFVEREPGMAVRALQRTAEFGGRLDVADHDLAAAGGQRRQDGATNLHPHQFLLRLPVAHSGHLGHRRAGHARPPAMQPTAARSTRRRHPSTPCPSS